MMHAHPAEKMLLQVELASTWPLSFKHFEHLGLVNGPDAWPN